MPAKNGTLSASKPDLRWMPLRLLDPSLRPARIFLMDSTVVHWQNGRRRLKATTPYASQLRLWPDQLVPF